MKILTYSEPCRQDRGEADGGDAKGDGKGGGVRGKGKRGGDGEGEGGASRDHAASDGGTLEASVASVTTVSSAVCEMQWFQLQECDTTDLLRVKTNKQSSLAQVSNYVLGRWKPLSAPESIHYAASGKVLVAVSCLRFSEVPDVLVRLPHLEAALREQSSMALRMGEDLWGLLGETSK